MKIVILADSLALPRPENEGKIPYEATYPYLLERSLRQKASVAPQVIERGMRRRTIEYVLDDWLEMVELRKPDILVVHVGIVDCAPRIFLRREGRFIARLRPVHLPRFIFKFAGKHRRRIVTLRPRVYVPAERFRRHLAEVAEKAAAAGIKSLVLINIITPPDALEQRSPGFQQNVRIYNRILEEEARRPGIHLVDINGLVEKKGGAENLLPDGIHINEAGHKLLARELETHILNVFQNQEPPRKQSQ
jgi:lysophospholipase L1-like esterase